MKAANPDFTQQRVNKCASRWFEVRQMKAAEASAGLDEAEWEEVNFHSTEIGCGGAVGGGGVQRVHSGSGQRPDN